MRADPHKRVLRRIVRGLYYHHFGQIVETETVVDANPMRKLPAEFAEFLPDMVLANVGGDAFIYRYGRAMESPQDSLWVLWFYRRHLVCGHTQTQERRTHTFDTDATPAALRVRSRVTG